MSDPNAYTFHVDALPNEDLEDHQTPIELAEAWQGELKDLSDMLPQNSGSWYAIDALRRNADNWHSEAQRVATGTAEEIPTQLPKQYAKYHEQALHGNIAYGQHVSIGAAHAPLAREYPTEQAVDGTLSQSIPQNMFESVFTGPFNRTPRQEAVHRAHQQTADATGQEYEQHVQGYFTNDVQPKVTQVAQVPPAEVSQKIVQELAESADQKLSPALDNLREVIMKRREIGLGAMATSQEYHAEQALQRATDAVRTALHVPTRYSNELSDVVDAALQKAYELPGAQEIAQHIAQMVDASRGEMVNRLHQQVADIVDQNNKGIHWSQMDVSLQHSVEKPQYEQEVDSEIDRMRREGLPDNKIYRRLMAKFHGDSGDDDPNKARYVSDLITATKPKQESRN